MMDYNLRKFRATTPSRARVSCGAGYRPASRRSSTLGERRIAQVAQYQFCRLVVPFRLQKVKQAQMIFDVPLNPRPIREGAVGEQAANRVYPLERLDEERIIGAPHEILVKLAAGPESLAERHPLDLASQDPQLLLAQPRD